MHARTMKMHVRITSAACGALIALGAGAALAQGAAQPAQPAAQPAQPVPAQQPAAQPAQPVPAQQPPRAQPPAGPAAQPQAPARPTVSTPPDAPAVHHAPVAVATPHEELLVRASIDRANQVRRALLVYRTFAGATREVVFQRASEGPYLAAVPAADMLSPSISYTIEIEDTQGRRMSVFATREAMHSVQVPDDIGDLRERALARRNDNRRSLVSASAEYVYFGRTTTPVVTDDNPTLHDEKVPDQYYRIEGAYTYRPWRTIAEFSIRIGAVRGTSIVEGEQKRSKYDVGLNYGSPSVRFRLHDAWHLEGWFLTSVTEVGFSAGGGGALLIGDPYGSKLTIGGESIQTFGSRFYTRMDIQANRRLQVAPIIEVTDMPHASRAGVRLLGETRFDVGGGLFIGLRGGYQARVSTSGGATGGAILAYAF